MFYVKSKINDNSEIRIEIGDSNVFTICPDCGGEFQIDLEAILHDGGSLLNSSCLCAECSEIHLELQKQLRQKENA